MLNWWFESYTGYPRIEGGNFNKLDVDEAFLNITSKWNSNLKIYSLNKNCINCPFVFDLNIKAGSSEIMKISTISPAIWRIYSSLEDEIIKPVTDKRSLICEIADKDTGEFGFYSLLINEDSTCPFFTVHEPVNIYPSLFFVVGLFATVYILIKFGNEKFKNFFLSENRNNNEDEVITVSEGGKKNGSRIKSIDTFRGLALSIMILVNDGGGKYRFLMHTPWDGIVLADVVFPWFLWIMGICIALSKKSLVAQNLTKRQMFRSIFQRGLILFVLGLSLNTIGVGSDLNTLRIPGVLQRFALTYVVVTSISCFVSDRHLKINILPELVVGMMKRWPQFLIYFCIMIVHTLIVFYFPVSGCPSGYLGAGGIQNNGLYENCTGGATGYIDRIILGEEHMWKGTIEPNIYHIRQKFDPENILGCFPSILQVYLGLQAGLILINVKDPKRKMFYWLSSGCVNLLLGYFLHSFEFIPINKNLWSLSFVFVTSGSAFILLTLFFLIIDYFRLWDGAPFIYPGMNSILVYVGHEVCYNLFPWHWRYGSMNNHFILLFENMWGLSIWILISAQLYRKQFFLSI